MTNLQQRLFDMSDSEYAAFQSKLTPGIDVNLFIGVRVPVLRKFAREYYKEPEHIEFMNTLPHEYYDENMLHGLLIENIKDYDECIRNIDEFLPYVDNWSVCDIMSPRILKNHTDKLIDKILKWVSKERAYTVRFAVRMLMSHYLDDEFNPEYLLIPAGIKSEEYYVRMMVAWYYATALAKQWDDTITYIENRILDEWTHRKTIQKARESNRISKEHKEYLKTLK